MISSRLTATQKEEILKAYKAGYSTYSLAEKYTCSINTINRTVKSLLTDSEYKLLKVKRSKVRNKKGKINHNQIIQEFNNDLERSKSSTVIKEKMKNEDLRILLDDDLVDPEVEEIGSLALEDIDSSCDDLRSENQYNMNNQKIDNNFELIEPLVSSFDFDQDNQKVDFKILDFDILPESVYMIVDKKVELDLQLISDLPEWSFLPENELKRNAILLFSHQRSAKRSCSRNQRVIKIPNTSIFDFSKSYLISKGITRLIFEDSIIALDN